MLTWLPPPPVFFLTIYIFLSCPIYLQIVPLLAHQNEDISREALALMKALLFSGNEDVQGGLASSVEETREEILFLHLKQRIEIASLNYKERYVIINIHNTAIYFIPLQTLKC